MLLYVTVNNPAAAVFAGGVALRTQGRLEKLLASEAAKSALEKRLRELYAKPQPAPAVAAKKQSANGAKKRAAGRKQQPKPKGGLSLQQVNPRISVLHDKRPRTKVDRERDSTAIWSANMFGDWLDTDADGDNGLRGIRELAAAFGARGGRSRIPKHSSWKVKRTTQYR